MTVWASPTGAPGSRPRSRWSGAGGGLAAGNGALVYNYHVPDPSLRERALAETRAALGDAAFEEARKGGRAMTFEQAVTYALSESGA